RINPQVGRLAPHVSGALWMLLCGAAVGVVVALGPSPSLRDAPEHARPVARPDLSALAPAVVPKAVIWAEPGSMVWSLQLSPDDRYVAAKVGREGESIRMRVLIIERFSGQVIVDTPGYFRVYTCFTAESDALVVYSPNSYPFTRETMG